MKIVVGGGSGFVGKNLCGLLRRNGHEVCVVSRTASKPPVDGCQVITWDAVAQTGLPSGTDAAINLAGEKDATMKTSRLWVHVKTLYGDALYNVDVSGANILDPMKRWNTYSSIVRSSRLTSTELMANAIAETSTPPKVFVSASAVG